MFQYNLTASQPAVLLVSAGDGPSLIVNNDPAFTLWLGDSNAAGSANTYEAIPIAPNGWLGVDGSKDVYGSADPSATNAINVLVIAGGMSFFQLFSQLVIQGSAAGVFIYSPTAGNGTLIGSWSAIAGTDKYGNTFPAGINVSSGVLGGVGISNAQILTSIIQQAIITNSVINQPTISGGSMQETNITFDPTGGQLLIYSQTTTSQVFNTVGDFQFTGPANATSGKVEVWGAGAGAGGGNASNGGETGGAGEYSCEPNYPLVTGQVYNGTIGAGGQGGITGQSGSDGGDSQFDGQNVFANGGSAGVNFQGGAGGTGSTNTIHHDGGSGANAGNSTGGSSGANSGGPTGKGNNAIQATTSSGAAAPTAQGTDFGQGPAGGGNGANGSNGGSPGASGSACGSGSSANTISKSYQASSSRSWYGADGSSPNQTRDTNGIMYQGGESSGGGSFNGTQKSACLFPSSQIQSDFAGATMTGATFYITNQHTWYNSGASVQIKQWPSSLGTSLPGSWDGTGATLIGTPSTGEGQRKGYSLGSNVATNFKNGTTRGIAIGPGPGSLNLNYYAYFTGTPNNSGGPVLVLTGTTGTGSNQAGNGANGQVRVTYAATQTLIVSLAGAAGTDAFGNNFPAGLGILQPSGQYVRVSGASTNLTNRTVTQVGNNQITNLWAIPANDASVGTIYRLTAWGTGTQGSTQEQLNTNLFLNGSGGTNLDNTNLASATIAASQNFHWRVQVSVIITATGAAGTCVIEGILVWSQAVATSSSNAASGAMSDTGKAFNTTVANTLGWFVGWAATTGAPTITCAGSMLERLGP